MNRKTLWLEKEFTIIRWICFGIRNFFEFACWSVFKLMFNSMWWVFKKMFAGSSTSLVRYIVEFDIITKADTQKIFTLNLFWMLKFPNCSFSFTRSASHMFESIQIKCLIHLNFVFIHGTFKYIRKYSGCLSLATCRINLSSIELEFYWMFYSIRFIMNTTNFSYLD